jgi:thiosulfate dehydrogenase (quinone) large subunit
MVLLTPCRVQFRSPGDVISVKENAMAEEMDLWLRDVTLAYALLRIALGLNICLHGVVRWAAGLRNFAESLLPIFQKTPLPTLSVFSFGFVLPIVEAAVGACVLFGFQTRRALISGSVLMLVLMFGSTLRQDWPTVGIQLTYSLVYTLLLAWIRFNSYSIDRQLSRSQ